MSETTRVSDLENRAAELERRLLAATTSANGQPAIRYAAPADNSVSAGTPDDPAGPPAPSPAPDDQPAGRKASDDAPAAGDQADALASYRRPAAERPGRHGLLRHWRLVAVGGTALAAGVVAVMVTAGSPAPGWPASVAVVQGQVETACENPDVAAEPSGLNFACAEDTRQVLWVFSLLTSGDNPRFTDPATGREGLEPITRAQGGSIAWSLNLHHPYDPASPVDSLAVAARAVNSIIAGATVTSASGGAEVQPGLESSAANCERYTGSSALVTRAGYPAQCKAPLTTAGTASLVSDVFGQWMNGAPAKLAADAGVLFANADNPGSPQVRAILASLPASGQ